MNERSEFAIQRFRTLYNWTTHPHQTPPLRRPDDGEDPTGTEIQVYESPLSWRGG